MITFLIIIFAVALIITLFGEIYGKEPFMGSSFLTYPFKIQFKRRWVQLVYRFCWVGIIIALSADITFILYSHGILQGWDWLLLAPILVAAACLFIVLSMVAAIAVVVIGLFLCLLFNKEGFADL